MTSSIVAITSRRDRGSISSERALSLLMRDKLKFTALEGMLSGHADGILTTGPKISDIGYPCLWEHKAINAKG